MNKIKFSYIKSIITFLKRIISNKKYNFPITKPVENCKFGYFKVDLNIDGEKIDEFIYTVNIR